MVKCLMLYEHTVRDLPMYQRIAGHIEAESCGEVTVSISSFHFEWAKEMMLARKNPPDIVVVPWMRWSPHFDLMWPFYQANKNVKFLVLNQEQLGSPCSCKLLVPQNEYARKGCYHCAWTEHYADLLVNAGVPRENVYITGNAKLQESAQSNVTRQMLADEFGLNSSKRWVLFAESRNVPVMQSVYFQDRQRRCGITEEDITANLKYYEESITAFYDQLWEIPAEFFEKNELIYRLHPGMRLQREVPATVKVIDEHPISDWMPNIDVLVTPGSTTVFEAEIAGKPAIVHNAVPFNSRYIVDGVGEYLSVDRIEDIDDACIERAARLQTESAIYERYVGSATIDGAKEIARSALDVLYNRGGLPVKVPKWNPKVGARFLFMDMMSFVMAKTGLLKKTKWPHTAYHSIRDLPSGWLRE